MTSTHQITIMEVTNGMVDFLASSIAFRGNPLGSPCTQRTIGGFVMSEPCNQRFHTWIEQKIGGSMIGEVVVAELYDDAQSELAALREELAQAESMRKFWANSAVELDKRLTAAEQRNADLLSAMEMMADNSDDREVVEICRNYLKPTESGASE